MQQLGVPYRMLMNKYYFDWFNENVMARGGAGARRLASGRSATETLIDGLVVNGSAQTVGLLSGVVRSLQSGYLYTTRSRWCSVSPCWSAGSCLSDEHESIRHE